MLAWRPLMQTQLDLLAPISRGWAPGDLDTAMRRVGVGRRDPRVVLTVSASAALAFLSAPLEPGAAADLSAAVEQIAALHRLGEKAEQERW